MAKVTIVLEDGETEDGQKSLVVRPEFHEEFDENSIAQAWGEAIIELILENSKQASEVERAPNGELETDTSKH